MSHLFNVSLFDIAFFNVALFNVALFTVPIFNSALCQCSIILCSTILLSWNIATIQGVEIKENFLTGRKFSNLLSSIFPWGVTMVHAKGEILTF